MLDDKGRCCGRKPIHYKGRLATRQLFCCRCDRSYDVDTKQQRENFAWKKEGSEFVRKPIIKPLAPTKPTK